MGAATNSGGGVRCRLRETEGQLARLRSAGHDATVKEFTSLLEACKRSNQAARAAHILHSEMPSAGIRPDSHAWNALLGAYGRNGDIDGAYATWQVRRSRHLPNRHNFSGFTPSEGGRWCRRVRGMGVSCPW